MGVCRTEQSDFCYLSLYLMTASTIFFIFFVREGGLGESFSTGGRPLFLCLFPSSSLSPLPRPPKDEEGPGRSRSRSLLLLRVVFLWRTSSSTSSRVPSSIACARQEQEESQKELFNPGSDISVSVLISVRSNNLQPLLLSQRIAVVHLFSLPRTSPEHFLLLLLARQSLNLGIVLHDPSGQLILLHQTWFTPWVAGFFTSPVQVHTLEEQEKQKS